jgi:hypothetical protein
LFYFLFNISIHVIFDEILLFIAEKMKNDYQYSDDIKFNFYLIMISIMKQNMQNMQFIILDVNLNVNLNVILNVI